jgi:hypothetical protein
MPFIEIDRFAGTANPGPAFALYRSGIAQSFLEHAKA